MKNRKKVEKTSKILGSFFDVFRFFLDFSLIFQLIFEMQNFRFFHDPIFFYIFFVRDFKWSQRELYFDDFGKWHGKLKLRARPFERFKPLVIILISLGMRDAYFWVKNKSVFFAHSSGMLGFWLDLILGAQFYLHKF